MKKIIFIILVVGFACTSPIKKTNNFLVSKQESEIKQEPEKKIPIKVFNFSQMTENIDLDKNIKINCSNYETLSSNYASRACKIFNRVLKASDNKSYCYPKLSFVNKPGLVAYSLENGTIIMYIEVVDFCFDHVSNDIGDSRLAFILGHEIAHIVNDHFWTSPINNNQNIYKKKLKVDKKINHNKEFQADYHGLLYATMAGFDPKAIADSPFIEKWLKYSHNDQNSDTHPSPEKRKLQLLELCKKMEINIRLFDIGISLYLTEKYDDALDFLETFKRKYPGKETFNNVGLIYYKKAFNTLINFDSKRAYQFNFATAYDIRTNAESFVKRNRNENEFRMFIDESIRNLEDANKKDNLYFNARLNLSSAYMLSGKCSNYRKAYNLLEETINLIINKELLLYDDDNINLLINNLAIAIYLCGTTYINDSNKPCDYFIHSADFKKIVINYLMKIFNKDKKIKATVAYNLGRIFWEDDKKDKASSYWLKYINKNPEDLFAVHLKKILNLVVEEKKEQKKLDMSKIKYPSYIKFSSKKYIQLVDKNFNEFNKIIDKTKLLNLADLGLDNKFTQYYSGDDFNALFLDKIAVYVEITPQEKVKMLQGFEESNNYHYKTRSGYKAYKQSSNGINSLLYERNNVIKKIILYH